MEKLSLQNKKIKNKKLIIPAAMKIEPLIWAIDTAKIDETQIKKFHDVLKSLNYQSEDVIPVTLFSPFDLGWVVPADPQMKKKAFAEMSSSIKEKWDKLSISFSKESLLIIDSNSIRNKAQALIQFALRKKAKMILIGSGAKSRSDLFGIGSFSETLIAMSPLPVLVVGESIQVPTPISKILFPTDFSEVSKSAFKKVARFAKNFDAQIILYHFLDLDAGPIAYGVPWGYEMKWLEDYWRVQEESKKAEGAEWKNWALRRQIRCEYRCDRKSGGFRERILEVVKEEKINILTVTIKRGPLAQVILGRHVRGLFADSTCPVLAIHSKAEKLEHLSH